MGCPKFIKDVDIDQCKISPECGVCLRRTRCQGAGVPFPKPHEVESKDDIIERLTDERDEWRTMAGRLAATLNEAAVIDNWGYFDGDEFFACLGDMSLARCCVFYRQDAMNVLEEHDALVAREVKS